MKRPEEANKVDDPNYCKYHRLVNHPIKKCFVLKDRILQFYEDGKIEFEEEMMSSNLASVKTISQLDLPTMVKFSSFDPICLSQNASMPMRFQQKKEDHMHFEDNHNDEGWTIVTRRKSRKSRNQIPIKVSIARKEVLESSKTRKPKMSRRKKRSTKHGKARKPITLNEYMPAQFRNEDSVPVTCCHVNHDDDFEDEDKVDTSTLHVGDHSGASKISFSDEDLLLGSTPHNRPLFVVGYAREQKVNRILIDDGSAVNILPLKVMKELGVPLDELTQSRLMIQGFNQGGQRALGKLRLQLFIGDMESNALFHVIDSRTTYNMLLGRP